MKLEASLATRLEFLARVTVKECQHLLDTDKRLFGNLFTVEEARKIAADPILAERLDAFMYIVTRQGAAAWISTDSLKVAAIQEADVYCTSKGKKYKFMYNNDIPAGLLAAGRNPKFCSSASDPRPTLLGPAHGFLIYRAYAARGIDYEGKQ